MTDRERDAPDLEDLAAYLDGRLSGERRVQVEERLLRDEDYYEVFMETVRFREESTASGDGVVVAPPAWRPSWRVAAPLAVAAALVAVIGLWRLGGGPSADEWVGRLDAAKIVGIEEWDQPGWPRFRSGGPDPSRYRPEQLAFRLGVRAVDLRLALAAGDAAAARRHGAELGSLAGAADLFAESAAYAALLREIEAGALEGVATRAAEIEAILAESLAAGTPSEERRFRLGAWTEAGRLAAVSGNAHVLADVFRHRRLAESTEEIAPQLAALETALEPSDGGAADFAAAAQAFEDIVQTLAG